MTEKQLWTPRSVKKEARRRCLKCQSREPSLAARDEDHGEAGCSPAAHGGPWWSRYPPVARGRDPMLEQVDV